jgi:hypothetical protein
MAYTFDQAGTDEQREAVFRFRYSVYVEEMGRYRSTADHANRRLVEAEDSNSHLFFARDGDDVVATARLTCGADGFSDRQIQQYSLQPFLDALPARVMAVGERAMVEPRLRGTGLLEQLMAHSHRFIDDLDIRIIFGACEPHLLSMYLGWGQRTYADRNINSAEAGYLIPLVTLPKGIEGLAGVGLAGGPAIPECLERIGASSGGAVHSSMLMEPAAYEAEVRDALRDLGQERISAFDDFSDAELERCLARSNIIECDNGDRVLKRGGQTQRHLFVLLDGTLEVRDGDRVLGVVSQGEVFGEIGFLLERPRGLDVYAAADGTRVLSLSAGTLRAMSDDDPIVAAKLLLNVSRMLCLRLIRTQSAG